MFQLVADGRHVADLVVRQVEHQQVGDVEGVLGEPGSLGHFMSTASAQTKDGTLLFSPAFLSQVISRMDKVVLRWSETWDSQAA